MTKRLITSALPYVNNIPHLGNLIQVLSADVFARFCRSYGYETMFVCGTDEYGTATETKALELGVSPKELCDKYNAIHTEIYKWFNVDFDNFGRTSTPAQTEIVQSIFKELDKNGFIIEKTTKQLFCPKCDRFLADRYVTGTCPVCGYTEARGDQCESCGKLLDPTELKDPKCSTCGETPIIKETKHLYIDLPKAEKLLETWMDSASVKGFWAKNAIAMTKSWIRDGLKERCITRDLKWGIPVPKEGFENKVFYVWFDAPIGYISITASKFPNWKEWWQNPENVELFQFIGKDNIPFHTVIFPSSLLASGKNWTMLHHLSSTEYLNYENGKFSKSKGTGIFGDNVRDSEIPADVWRFYIFYNRPEKADVQFTWADFQEKVNGELIGNLGNLINRTLTFLNRFYDGIVPEAAEDEEFNNVVLNYEKKITEMYDRADLRDALRTTLELSSYGNKIFQEGEPWKLRKEKPEEAAALLKKLTYLIRDLAILISPVMPTAAKKIGKMLCTEELKWSDLGKRNLSKIDEVSILFTQLEDEKIVALREKYSGKQASQKSVEQQFADTVLLKVGKIIEIENHPDASKLYVEKVDFGNGETRQIVSGLVNYYTKEELINKNVIIAYNLKSAKLRGVLSEGMVLAASCKSNDGEIVEVIFTDKKEGTVLTLENISKCNHAKEITIDDFFKIPITVTNNEIFVAKSKLLVDDVVLKTAVVKNGEVG